MKMMWRRGDRETAETQSTGGIAKDWMWKGKETETEDEEHFKVRKWEGRKHLGVLVNGVNMGCSLCEHTAYLKFVCSVH